MNEIFLNAIKMIFQLKYKFQFLINLIHNKKLKFIYFNFYNKKNYFKIKLLIFLLKLT